MGYYSEYNADKKIALITSRGNGSADIHRTYEPAFVTNNSFMVLTNKYFEYLSLAFTLNLLKLAGLKSYCSGAAQPQLTNDAMKNLSVVLPSKNLIEQFNDIVMPSLEVADNLRVQNQNLREARDILLPRLMTGVIDAETYQTNLTKKIV
jgi:type I restriction enzyme S subunit